ncbi:hypothetical protein TWF506_008967 [Arthrobotrys conoides]|uniref:Uncharacterized protein n=1 Tax=Arthrobotrys conoides TaxID=74498 RepID=A0AAN8RTA7_9PEZI
MPAAPIAKGVIIMCAVLIAAGYTVYENRDQVKELVDRTRRKISLAMHTFAEEIMPSEGPRQRHQPMAFSGRSLESSGHIHRPNSRTRSRRNSTDSITLRGDDEKAEGSSRDAYLADSALRYRPPYPYRGSAEDSESSSLNAKPSATSPSPFDDENQVLFDATTEVALDQHINEKTLSSSPGSDTSSDTLPPTMSEKGIEMSHDAPPMIPAVLPTVIDQPPPLPPRPSHPQFQEVLPVIAAIPAVLPPATVALPPPPPPQQEEEPGSDVEDSHTTFSTSQPYWAIQQWTVDVTNNPNVDEDENLQSRTPSRALSEDEDDEEEEDERLTLQSLHSQSETVSVIGSDEGESEDDRVEFVSDLASSVGDTDGWSDLGSQYSEGEGRM